MKCEYASLQGECGEPAVEGMRLCTRHAAGEHTSGGFERLGRHVGDLKSKLEGMTRSRDKWRAKYYALTAAIVRVGGLPKKPPPSPQTGTTPEGR